MHLLDFSAFPALANLGVFVAAAVAVWFAGTRLSVTADAIAERTGWERAFVGLVMLAGATELPELVTTVVAASTGSAALAVNNLFGGVAMQTAVLVLADLALRRYPLTFVTPRPDLLMQGLALIVLLALALAASLAGELVVVAHVGLWSALLFLAYLAAMRMLQRYEPAGAWQPVDMPDELDGDDGDDGDDDAAPPGRGARSEASLARLGWGFAGAAFVVLVAGVLLARSAEALAAQSGLGQSFIGATLLASSTSLPEVSTTIGCVRVGSHAMAIANIFGSNSIMVALLLVCDVAYAGGPILDAVDPSARFVMVVGIVLTAAYLVGVVERKDRAWLRLGLDSWFVLIVYAASLGVLYTLR